MIQLIEGAPEGVLAFEAVGEVDAEDYEHVLKPAIEESLAGSDQLRFVFEIGAEFDRFTAGAEWQDMTLGFAHFSDWLRCALVTDLDWVRHAAKALGWLMGGRLRVFEIDELKAALEWAAADD
ncbi:MAG TPA: STAS/SEC14 domain-containing protein [Thermoleophilia bacterium]|nr:STAS/SEC14 domain-containing protein [Thermoleophilia bacterium]